MILKPNKECKICGVKDSLCVLTGNILREYWYRNKFTPGNGWLCRSCYNGFTSGWTYGKLDFEISSLHKSIAGEMIVE